MKDILKALQEQVYDELTSGILPFWLKAIDVENGGFFGRVDGHGAIHPQADKGVVLHARILWAFSAAYRLFGNSEYLMAANRAKEYIINHFWDTVHGGVYWSVDYKGRPRDTKKQIYAQGFALYGFSEYYRATGDEPALARAIELYRTIETHAFDESQNGYWEAFSDQWKGLADVRLSDKDANERKTMNTHLHILEPYANLYRVWKDAGLEKQLRNLIDLFTAKIVNPESGHLELFFDEGWTKKGHVISYGHDIEASWLLHEAALVIGDAVLLARVAPWVQNVAKAAAEGLQPDGSMVYEYNAETAHTDMDRHWWVQAETVVGYFNIFEHFGGAHNLENALRAWEYVKENLVIPSGEWYWSINADGSVNESDDRAGLWKCPYHNGRMCIELYERLSNMLG